MFSLFTEIFPKILELLLTPVSELSTRLIKRKIPTVEEQQKQLEVNREKEKENSKKEWDDQAREYNKFRRDN